MFRFKKIIPCVLLSACVASSVCVMSACNSGKDYSEDIAKLQQQIEDLQNENNSLKDQISNITPGGTDYTEDIEKLQQQIEALKVQNASYLEESTKLKQQIETLKTNNESNLSEISKLEQQLENLKTNNESNLAEIDKLQQQIEAQKKLIESLQSATNTEPKIYKVGETFTYSYQGIDFFSIKLSIDPEYNWWQITIKNLKMDSFKECGYVSYYVINKTGTIGGAFKVTDTIDQNNEINCDIRSVDSNYIKLVVGFPLQDNNLIPYAVFDLTSSV